MTELFLNELFNISTEEKIDWTICLNNGTNDNVYSFTTNEKRLMEHISWKKHAGSNVSFRIISTKYCLQFIRLDKDKKWDQWLFLGAYEKTDEINKFDDGHETYNLVPIDKFEAFKERLIVRYKRQQGPKCVKLPIDDINKIAVVQLLDKKYGDVQIPFEGYNKVSLPFIQLKEIIEKNNDEWRIALSNVNCVYVITDTYNGNVYIGSTYGYDGIWGRWSCYVYTNGTGHNDALDEILKNNPEYPAKNFKWSILECFYTRDGTTQLILDREKYWKTVFDSRQHGYNKN
uniref:GIY-YIG nuclease family protein n=1 Tax=Candidatus Fimenecus sp. TaxID=3022888 RepID=UPI004027F6ED